MKHLFAFILGLSLCACGSINTQQNPLATSDSRGVENPQAFNQPEAYSETDTKTSIRVTEVLEKQTGLIESLAGDFSWQRHTDRPEVKRRIKSYSAKPEQLQKILARSSDFLPLIAEEIKARDLPAELAFLPLVESGYQTDIYSRAGAAGLWQLMPATARYLGLQIDWWYDERLDIQASTLKALNYLEYLHKQFKGDWELAITAYNGGEGHVRSKMRKAKSRNFWDLSLKRETEDYLPRLLAIAEIIDNPEKYNIKLPRVNPVSNLETIAINHQIDLRLTASSAGLDYKKFRQLNPSYQRWISPPKGEYSLLLPKEEARRLKGKLASLQPDQLASWDHYRVKSGDTLIDIARKFGTTVRSLIAVNELANSRIYARQELLIPRTDTRALATSTDTIKELYIVQSGDSLWSIAHRNDLSVQQLKKLNAINGRSVIQPGQVLILNQYFDGEQTTYKVKRGDSLSEIAHQFDVAVIDLKAWNALGNNDLIHPGQVLKILAQAKL